MAENVYSFGKLPADRAAKIAGGYYPGEPRGLKPRERLEVSRRRLAWISSMPTDAASRTAVLVLLDDGTVQETFTRSKPWQVSGGVWVVLLYGRTGGFALERVAARKERAE